MDRPPKHKTRKSRNEPGHLHFLTFSTYHRKPYLRDDRINELIATRINEASKSDQFIVLAYVLMPDHVHLLIRPMNDIYDISKILKAIKQGPSYKAHQCGLIETQLWERGGGYDRNVTNIETRTKVIDYIHHNPVKRGLVSNSWDYRWSSANWYFNQEACDIVCTRMSE
jgi:putative transposase